MTSASRVVTNYVRVLPGNVRGEIHRDTLRLKIQPFYMLFTDPLADVIVECLLRGEVHQKLMTVYIELSRQWIL